MLTDLLVAPPPALAAFEAQHRSDHEHEHAVLYDAGGKLLVTRTGEFDKVDFTPAELDRACQGLLSHNHPRCLPPSGEDLTLAAAYGLTLRAIGETESGEALDYTVRMPGPSAQMAERIKVQFDNELARTEQELSTKPMSDRAWQRESRHLAVERLAERFGFSYTRQAAEVPVVETVRDHEIVRLDRLADVETVMVERVLAPLAAAIVHVLTRNADSKGIVPIERLEAVRQEMSRLVLRAMLGKPLPGGALQPFIAQGNETHPRSAYFAALWDLMRAAAQAAIDRHADLMRRYLPADLVRMFEYADLSPFETTVQEMDEGDEPRLAYDPLHLWLGPDGKRLSDRIWQAAGDMRARLDQYLSGAIARNLPVQQIAGELEQFLVEGKGAFEAMRLARTEVAAAHARADSAAAQLNPFAESYNFFTAPSHECCDECDEVQAGSPYPKGDTTHLPPRHPHCVCGISWNEVPVPAGAADRLRHNIEQAVSQDRKSIADWIGPLSKKFINLLFRSRG